MNTNELPIILLIIPVALILALIVFVSLKRSGRDSQLYDKHWRIYNRK